MSTTEQLERELDQNTFPLKRYKPIELLGHGMSGRAILCFDQFMEQDVVVKTMSTVELEQFIEFQRDAMILCKINSKHMVQMLDFGCTASGTAYVVSEYQPGMSLLNHINETEPLAPELALRLFIPISEVLSLMHTRGVLHRDIKTSNILVRNLDTPEFAVFLIDAGTGRIKLANMEPNSFEGRKVTGDPSYMAPEQAHSLHYDARSEVFALGCTLFEALTGRTPFSGADSLPLLVRRGAPSLTQASDGFFFPHSLENFIAKCLNRSPDSRYQSMQEVGAELRVLVKQRIIMEQGKPKVRNQRSSFPPASASGAARQAKQNPAVSDGSKVTLECDGEPQIKLVSADDAVLARENPVVFAEDMVVQTGTVGSEPCDVLFGSESSSVTGNGTYSASRIRSRTQRPQAGASQQTSGTPGTAGNASAGSGLQPVAAVAETSDLKGLAQALLARLVNFSTTGRYRFIAIGITIVLIVCGNIAYSYMSFLNAPRDEVEGAIYSYVPATDKTPGYLELGTNSGFTRIVRVGIESPDMNLPNAFAPDNKWDKALHDTGIFDANRINLGNAAAQQPEQQLESDCRIGEIWDLICRRQNGNLYLEEAKHGAQPATYRDFQGIHLTISTMFDRMANAQGEWISTEWATSTFKSSVKSYPPPADMQAASNQLFPAVDIKLLRFEPHECLVMVKSPAWLTDSSRYLTVTLILDPTWKVEKIESCSEHEWNRGR